ncbi:alpha/beta fold hydrolase [Algibacter sp. R77976]|uniref:alpha/beta fold hydrolase n=1 Tax=Algibacter sp. R77976 TaxID=3093873 RepID=UPI0037CC2CA2
MKTTFSLFVLICSITLNCYAQKDIKDNSVNFNRKGTGSPVVVFESGLGESLKGWSQIQDSISKIASTVSYDRLGLGESSPTEKPRNIDNLASELNDFLEDNKIDGPYVLVGHSLGGFIIRKFQDLYPEKVLGLVFVDPSHENLMKRILATKTEAEADMITKGMQGFYATKSIAIQNEFKEISNMEKEMKTIDFPMDIPITLIASYQIPPPPFKPEDIKIKKVLFNNWIDDKPKAKLISTLNSGHYIHYSEPTIVINAIIEMIENLK